MKIIFRKLLRYTLRYLSKLAINKHSLEIIVVCGWHGTDITTEGIYTILKKEGKKVRRTFHTPNVDWEIPLAVLGVKNVPNNVASWMYVILKTIVRLIVLKPNQSILVLQFSATDAGIMKYWVSFLNPTFVIILNSHAGSLNLDLLLMDSIKRDGVIVLNNDSVRTKSLSQGRSKGILFFGEASNDPDFGYSNEHNSLVLHYNNKTFQINKKLPEFSYPFLTASTSIASYYHIDFENVAEALNYFEVPSEKLQKIFMKFIEED